MTESDNTYPYHSSFRRVTQDVLDLVELQLELLSVDSQEARRKLATAVVCGAVAVMLAGSALTVVLVGGGFLLNEWSQLSTGSSLLIVGGAVCAIVVLLGWIALTAVKKAAYAMSETKSEFAENLGWLKATLISPKTSPRNQLRRDSFDVCDSDSSRASDWRGSSFVEREPTRSHRR